ncbi:MFS transporter [Achromobacter deleyi]|uniref:MFS transporter n=1 Tax=Achromobacter deleyi TaxID=1353891 RepID=UPI0014917C32|nr:MFS transporter [Achromobacter deleyi]QVQ26095.1 MFS transporter [Achromobacter deleyi]UIP21655.1 MFS transporter [Achromobacter deleyi]
MPVSDVSPLPSRPRRALLACLSLAMLLSSLGTSIANVGLPTLAQAFGVSFQAVQWVVLAYLLAITTAVVSAGRLGDLIGRRRLMLAGLALFTAASVLCGAAPGLWVLVAARAVQGLGAAVLMALTMAFAGEAVPKDRVGSAMGLLGAMSAAGTALGPTLGGALIAGAGWRAIFLVNLPLGMLAFWLAWRHLPADRRRGTQEPVRFDGLGSALLALSLAAYALSMTLGRGSFGLLNGALLAAAAGGAGLFMWVEFRTAHPLIRPAMFGNAALAGGFAASALVATVMMATLVVGPFYLAGALGLDAPQVGMAMSCGPLVAALAGVPAGRCVDRFGARPMTLAALLAMAAASAMLPMASAALGVAGYVAPLAVVTAGYALFQAANNTVVMGSMGGGERGAVSGLLNLSRNLGLITGASAMGAVFAAGAGTAELASAPPEALAAGLRAVFATAAALILLAAAVAAASRTKPAAVRP